MAIMTIEKKLTGWIDEDAHLLSSLDSDERIDYFEKRVSLVLVEPLNRLWKSKAILGSSDSSALLIVGVSTCLGIEALGNSFSIKV